ncbi:hypothetical protein [Rhizobium sp. Root482]|uniref:hypothetical protein n=1 Tax=Rhizobium sp. Root482 TaxID=1736543 RepID=UPI0009E82395|nr:hypothetical protein [Rhizobium sp. Root482]
MVHHKFTIGTEVRLLSLVGLFPEAAETYRITALLPVLDRSPQYRLRNEVSRQERVSKEDNLTATHATSIR